MAQGTAPSPDLWRNNLLYRLRPGGNQQRLTVTRADATTCATYLKHDGTVGTTTANTLRVEWVDTDGDGVRETPSYLLENSRPNSVTVASDATNVAWTKTSCTALKNAVGPDGTANTASTLTATATGAHAYVAGAAAGAGTRQAVSGWVQKGSTAWAWVGDRSDAVFHRAWVNLATGALGTLENCTATVIRQPSGWIWWQVRMTMTNAVTPQPVAGMATGDNVTTCIAGDTLRVALHQHELNAVFSSSSILTTGVSLTRAADRVLGTANFGPSNSVTVLGRFSRPVHADVSGTLGGLFPGCWSIGTTTPALECYCDNTARLVVAEVRASASSIANVSQAMPSGTVLSFCAQYKNLLTGGQVALDVGSGFGAFSSAVTGFGSFGDQTIDVGRSSSNGVPFFGNLLDWIVVRGLLTREQMLAIP